jgi:hypothetical protein
LREPLDSAISELADELVELGKTWFQEPPAKPGVVAAAVQRVVDRAHKLRAILTRLPTGIVLP